MMTWCHRILLALLGLAAMCILLAHIAQALEG